MTRTVKVDSNAQAVHEAIKYCQGAITSLEKMKLTPELDLPGIEALKVGIPRIDIYTEVTWEKPFL